MEPRLETPRLLLRPLRPADGREMTRWCSTLEVARFVPVPRPYTDEVARSYIASALDGSLGEQVYAIDAEASGGAPFLGCVGLKGGDDDGERRLGYWLSPPHWGRGYATEAAGAVLRHAFAATAMRKASAAVYSDNPASWRVLAKLGFRRAGEGRSFSPARGASVREFIFTLEKGDSAGTESRA